MYCEDKMSCSGVQTYKTITVESVFAEVELAVDTTKSEDKIIDVLRLVSLKHE